MQTDERTEYCLRQRLHLAARVVTCGAVEVVCGRVMTVCSCTLLCSVFHTNILRSLGQGQPPVVHVQLPSLQEALAGGVAALHLTQHNW